MGNGEGIPYQYRRNYGRCVSHANGEAGHNYNYNWLFRKRGSRGRMGVAGAVAVFSFCLSFLILSGISSIYNIHHRNLSGYSNDNDNDAPQLYHPFHHNDSDSFIATNIDTNINHNNTNERIHARNGNTTNTIKTDTIPDTDNIAANQATDTTDIRPTVIITGRPTTTPTTTTTTTRPAAHIPQPCDWLDDIDTHINTEDRLSCGVNKCAFHSTRSRRRRSSSGGDSSNSSSSSSPIRFGYLVIDEGKKTLPKNQRSYEFAQHLTKTFSIRHTLLAPPRRTDSKECNYRPIDQNFTDGLNQATVTNRYLKTFQPDRPLVLQPIELLPEGSLLFKCDTLSYKKAIKNLEDFAISTTPLHVDFPEWEHRLRWDLNVTETMLENKEGECLGKDFQIVFDKYNGSIIHIDLDRCFERRKKNIWTDCKEKLVKFTEKMIHIKRPQNDYV